ncbi:GGDEF domain-containing protein [Amycolatopsis azurea]|uniref:GGDEF domain-containing protein n=1 Tax=Amycolatopsis azurea DSM 43854 TaxID=1238180 RepID=A0ABX3J3M9_9PSEU|nr:GGDEF domain-containing protein [Amycolatopsis azurea]OOC01652.1 GGDEF domain-containing protein [Amycolatopsis azurea DSM 43854]
MPYYLTLELAALVLPLVVPGRATTGRDWTWFGVLLLAAVLQAELSAQVERMRQFFATNPHINMVSIWTLAAALTVSPILACLLVIPIYAHLWLRVSRMVPGVRLYRVVCSAATTVITVLAACTVPDLLGFRDEPPGLVAIVLSGLTYFIVNALLVMIGFKLHDSQRGFVSFIGSWADNALDLVTLCLGGTTAVLLVVHPSLVSLTLLPAVLLPRGELGRQLEMIADRDHKTGLLTIAEWRKRADAELSRARRTTDPCGILMIDVDHFKRVNDTYGHLAGDAVLRAVAGVVQHEVRIYDSVGRFGGEEFVVLLPGIGQVHSTAIAERIREAVTKLAVVTATNDGETTIKGVSVSLGVAVYPHAGIALDQVLGAADKAVYRAKHLGRNQVCMDGFTSS